MLVIEKEEEDNLLVYLFSRNNKKENVWAGNLSNFLPIFLRIKRSVVIAGREVLFRKDNKALFMVLERMKLFDFYVTNAGHMIGLSQVVAFIDKGWKALANGFTAPGNEIEVHHMDGDPLNNKPSNLRYLSKQDHGIVSNCTNTDCFGNVVDCGSTPFNDQGKAVKSGKHYLANVIKETLAAVSKKRSGVTIKLSSLKILLALPKRLHKEVIRKYWPAWMTAQIMKCIDIVNPVYVL